jgi:hypothetical protein
MEQSTKHKHRKFRYIFIIIVIFIIGWLIYLGANKISGSNSKKNNLSSHQLLNRKSSNSQKNITNVYSVYKLPTTTCNTSISLVQLSNDYIVSGMDCYLNNSSNNLALRCYGSIFNHGTNVSLDCRQPNSNQPVDEIVCAGSTNIPALQNSMPISYSCSPSDVTNVTVYNCSGNITDTSHQFALNLPMQVSCTD